MDLNLTGRTAFVSGSTQGIGYAVAAALAVEGVTVIVNGRDEQRVANAVRRLTTDLPGAAVEGIVTDFADAAAVHRLAEQVAGVDILVNNVGLFELAAFVDVGDEDWQRYLDVNLMSGVRLSRRVLPGMLERGWGRILFVSSESGVNVPADMIHYGVTKAAMLALGNGLAKLTRGTAVTVNSILGGPTYSDGVARAVEHLAAERSAPVERVRDDLAAAHPTSLLARFIESSEIAQLAAYLASPLSSATNGAAVRADGGALTNVL